MKLSQLLASRSSLLRQATLANAAFSYDTLSHWARRISRARLHGPVKLLGVDPDAERFVPQLIALAGSQAVIDEHFNEGDLVRLADALGFVCEAEANEFEFQLEDLLSQFAPSLRSTLHSAGIVLDEVEPLGAKD